MTPSDSPHGGRRRQRLILMMFNRKMEIKVPLGGFRGIDNY